MKKNQGEEEWVIWLFLDIFMTNKIIVLEILYVLCIQQFVSFEHAEQICGFFSNQHLYDGL